MNCAPKSAHALVLTASVLVMVATIAGAPPCSADVLQNGLKIEKVMDLSAEVADLAQSPTGELWVLERSGTVRVVNAGTERATLSVSVSTACDSGLLDVAFAPDYAVSRRAFLSYVAPDGSVLVSPVERGASGLELGAPIVNAGMTADGCRPGGGLAIAPDGRLFVSVGDMGVPVDAQDDASLAGKMLRVELDGSVPADNPSGTLVWAKGFREGGDVALNPEAASGAGMLYLSDRGDGTTIVDELNAVTEGGNYGWDAVSGPDPSYDDPLYSEMAIGPTGVQSLTGAALGADAAGSLVFTCTQVDELSQALLAPDAMSLAAERLLYDPDGDRDGTPDAACPRGFTALTEGGDGWLYGANAGDNPGLWRIWRDEPGPREVSATGSPLPLTMALDGADLVLGWEGLGGLDVGRPVYHGGQRAETYQVWEGSLPLDGNYADLAPLMGTDGTPDPSGAARLTASVPVPSGSRYYLVTAQGDNMEGSLGPGRPATPDYCDNLGWGTTAGVCAQDWVHPMVDWNPLSPTYGQEITLSDFRGKTVRMDISADNCVYCDQQSVFYFQLDRMLRDRDLVIITMLMDSFSPWTAMAPADCATKIGAWAVGHHESNPVVCPTDLQVPYQYDSGSCGTPQNFYIDQGGLLYKYVCGGELSYAQQYNNVIGHVNPETCE